jgi:hypothetical protein
MNVMGILAKKLSGGSSAQVLAERAREVKTDDLLRNSSFVLNGWLGIGLDGTGLGKSYYVTNPETNKREEVSRGLGFLGGVNLGLHYRFISILSGVNIINDSVIYTPKGGPADGLKQFAPVSFLQIPVLLRLNFDFDKDITAFGLAGFAGLGFNGAAFKSDIGPYKPGNISFIAGAELTIDMSESGFDFAEGVYGYQWSGSLSDGSILVDGVSYPFKYGIHIASFGLRINLPFRKDKDIK